MIYAVLIFFIASGAIINLTDWMKLSSDHYWRQTGSYINVVTIQDGTSMVVRDLDDYLPEYYIVDRSKIVRGGAVGTCGVSDDKKKVVCNVSIPFKKRKK